MIATHETYELNYPITHQGREYTEFQVRRPKAKDVLRAVRKGGVPLEMDLEQLVHLAEVPREVVDDLDISDLNNLQDLMRSFANPSEAKVRDAIMALSIHAGWDLETLENLTIEEIDAWLKTLERIKPKA